MRDDDLERGATATRGWEHAEHGCSSTQDIPDEANAGTTEPDAVPHWDRDLSRREVFRLTSDQRCARLSASLARKLAIVEAAAGERDASARAVLPMNRTRLREWEDRGRRLWAWSDRQAERADGRHADAMTRFDLALAALKSRSGECEPASLEEQLVAKDRVIGALTRQVSVLITQLATRAPALDDRRR